MASEGFPDKALGYELPEHRDFEEYQSYELIGYIARETGTRTGTPGRTWQLSLNTLNSLYAYVTGEVFISPKHIGTERSMGTPHTRLAVAQVLDIDTYPTALRHSRPYRNDELRVMANHLHSDEHPDQRDWVRGY